MRSLTLFASVTGVSAASAGYSTVIEILENTKAALLAEERNIVLQMGDVKNSCDTAIGNNTISISRHEEAITKATAALKSGQAREAEATLQIEKTVYELSVAKKNLDAINAWFEGSDARSARKLFEADQESLNDTIDACSAATARLESVSGTLYDSSSFLQTTVQKVAKKYRTDFEILLRQARNTTSDGQETGVVHTNAGAAKVTEMIKDLSEAAKKEREALELDFLKTTGDVEVERKRLDGRKAELEAIKSDLDAMLAMAEGDIAKAKGSLNLNNEGLTNQKGLKLNNERDCGEDATMLGKNANEIRSDLAGIKDAIAILSTHTPSLTQTTSFLQISQLPAKQASSMLIANGKKLNSKLLLAVASSLREDPLEKVKSEITHLIDELEKQQEADAGNSKECFEMKTNGHRRLKDADRAVDLAQKQKENAETAREEKIGEKQDSQSELNTEEANLSQLNEERLAAKKMNEEAIAESEKQAELIGSALEILSATTSGSAPGPALLQKDRVSERGADSGLQKAMEKIEKIQTALLQAALAGKGNEEVLTQQHEESVKTKSKAIKNLKASIQQLTEEIATAVDTIWDLGETLRIGKEEHAAAHDDYYKRIVPTCDDMGAKRKRDRKQELDSLKDALAILGETVV